MTVTSPTDDEVEAVPEEHARRGPSLVQAILLIVALMFLTAVVTVWWMERDPKPNAADVGFYDDMTTHHFQAIAMAYAYLANGTDPVLQSTAKEVQFVQIGDIREMQAALKEWDRTGTPETAMEWMGMPVPQNAQPGMASKEQLGELARARGRELDDIYSRLMIDHHLGGVHMAEAAAERASLESVRKTAEAMAANQRTEVTELNLTREQLGLERYGE
jgi:uncharacterized protein (DUF305 family)